MSEEHDYTSFAGPDYAIDQATKMAEDGLDFTVTLDPKAALAFSVLLSELLHQDELKQNPFLYTLVFFVAKQTYLWFVENNPNMAYVLNEPVAQIELSDDVSMTSDDTHMPNTTLVFRGASRPDKWLDNDRSEWLDEYGENGDRYDVHGRVYPNNNGRFTANYYYNGATAEFDTQKEAKGWLLTQLLARHQSLVIACQEARKITGG
jgi:hypothetical protein